MTTALITALEQRAIVNRVDTTHHQHTTNTVLEDSRDEIEQMAQWARSAVEQGKHVGIVLPNLNQLRDRIEHHFAAITPKQYNLSAGKPLLHYEMLQVAVQALSLGRHAFLTHCIIGCNHPMLTIPTQTSGTPLNSIVVTRNALTAHQPQHYSRQQHRSPTSTWPTRLQAFHTQLHRVDQHLRADQRAHQFGELLHAIGWPGGRALDC